VSVPEHEGLASRIAFAPSDDLEPTSRVSATARERVRRFVELVMET
jgi:hypothetical protein